MKIKYATNSPELNSIQLKELYSIIQYFSINDNKNIEAVRHILGHVVTIPTLVIQSFTTGRLNKNDIKFLSGVGSLRWFEKHADKIVLGF